MEFGAFASAASFDNNLSLKTGYGGGGRIGMFLDPRWSIEFEDAEMRATRPNGLKDVNVGLLSGRLVAVPFKSGALSVLLGAGAGVSTETNFMHTYGVDALVGAKMALSENAALRVDGVWDWLANQDWKQFKSVRVGISLYRRPAKEIQTVTVVTPAPPPMVIQHEDSVSAAETRRLRDRDAALQALRDSLRNVPPPVAPPAVAISDERIPNSKEPATRMEAQVHFAANKSVLTNPAKATLDEKIQLFRDNPAMSIAIGTGRNATALGTRRAQAVKDYIIAHGIAESRVIIGDRSQPIGQPMFRLRITP
jgi:outer membrane protein OmpA-like peptidoglycan-associated protein